MCVWLSMTEGGRGEVEQEWGVTAKVYVSLWANKNGLKLISNGCITVSMSKTTELCALGELYHVLIISLLRCF